MIAGLKNFSAVFLALLSTLNVVRAFPTLVSSSQNGWVDTARAIYFQTNENANAIVSLAIHGNGTISEGKLTYTNGTGASMISAATNLTAAPDGLSSQGSVVVVGNSLFVVNAGDNSVSMFSINENDPTNITLVGEPASVPGDFPVTVSASALNGLLCVGTSGSRSGVACAPYAPNVGIGKMDFLRPFYLNQSNPPVGPLNTVSQIKFSDDESLLITTVKGNPSENKTGFVSTFTVSGSCLTGESHVSATGVQNVLNGTVALFGFQQIPFSSKYFSADPGYGAAIFSVDEKMETAQLLHKQVISDQMATCWAAISQYSNSAFVTDPLVNHIVEMSLDDASILSTVNTTSSNDASGYIDLLAAGKFVYALSPGSVSNTGAEVAVLSLEEGQNKSIIQSFDVSSWAGSSAQGLAFFP